VKTHENPPRKKSVSFPTAFSRLKTLFRQDNPSRQGFWPEKNFPVIISAFLRMLTFDLTTMTFRGKKLRIKGCSPIVQPRLRRGQSGWLLIPPKGDCRFKEKSEKTRLFFKNQSAPR
jgi:hypothetical protein